MQLIVIMRKSIFFSVLFGTFISCAPHVDYYKPLIFLNKENFKNDKNMDDFYYTTKYGDSSEIKTKLIVSSLPKKKELFFKVGLNNKIHIDSIKVLSKRMKFALNHKRVNDKIFTDEYSATFDLTDNNWYGSFINGKDTLNVFIYCDDKRSINIFYYFNYRNTLETYPF